MSNNFIFTGHAVEQFITRYDRTLSYDDALLLLETAVIEEKVTLLPEKTYSGELQWSIPSLGIVLISKTRRGGHVVVTVIDERHNRAWQAQDRQTRFVEALAAHNEREENNVQDVVVPDSTSPPKPSLSFVVTLEYSGKSPSPEKILNRLERLLWLGEPVEFRGGTFKVKKVGLK